MKTKAFFISGPQESLAIVFKKDDINTVIIALAEMSENDPEDYTATDIELEL